MTTRTPPQHGTRACYLRGCRRDECRDANRRYCKQYRVTTIHQPIRVDATPVINRLNSWVDQGYSQTQIQRVTNIASGDISKILNKKQRTVHPDLARRVLTAPDPTGAPYHAVTDSTGTIRRAQALHVIGYPLYQIAENVPMAYNHLGRILDSQPPTVRLSVAHGMTALYKRLRWVPGPSKYAPFSARRRGWHGPFAWDGNIDDPAAVPDTDPAGPRSGKAAPKRDSLRNDEIRHLAGFGIPHDEIARRVGLANGTDVRERLEKWRKEELQKRREEQLRRRQSEAA